MIRLNRILFPTEFSEPASHARDYAVALAEKYGAELHVLHVVDAGPPAYPDYAGSFWADYLGDLEMHARQRISEVVDAAWSRQHSVVTTVRQGTAYVEIIQYAREENIDLIVIGTHGRTGLSKMVMGSVAERVVRTAPCPVLTVRPPATETAE